MSVKGENTGDNMDIGKMKASAITSTDQKVAEVRAKYLAAPASHRTQFLGVLQAIAGHGTEAVERLAADDPEFCDMTMRFIAQLALSAACQFEESGGVLQSGVGDE